MFSVKCRKDTLIAALIIIKNNKVKKRFRAPQT